MKLVRLSKTPGPRHGSPSPHTAFETRWALHLFWCQRFHVPAGWRQGPLSLTKNRVAFNFVEKGTYWRLINGRTYECRVGDLMVLRGGDVATMWNERPNITATLGCAIEQGDVANVLLQFDFAKHYRLKKPKEGLARFKEILHALSLPIVLREWAVPAALLRYITFILEETNPSLRPGGSGSDNTSVKTQFAQSWASANLGRNFSLAVWAAAVALHPVYFGRIFRKHTGLSPKRWLTEQRMHLARQYLTTTVKTVGEVAEIVGYDDPFYFSRAFRKRYGRSPMNFRKESVEL